LEEKEAAFLYEKRRKELFKGFSQKKLVEKNPFKNPIKKAESEKLIEKPQNLIKYQSFPLKKPEKNIKEKQKFSYKKKADFITKTPIKISEIPLKKRIFVIDLRKLKKSVILLEKPLLKSLNCSLILEEKPQEVRFLNKSLSFSFNSETNV